MRKQNGNDTIKFGAEGSVTVPDSMKKIDIGFGVVEFGDFTYSVSGTTDTISAKVKKAPADLSEFFSEGDIIDVATFSIGTTASSGTTSSDDGTYGDYTSGNGTKDDYTSGEQKGESASNGTQGSSTSTSGIYKYYQMEVTPDFPVTNGSMTFTMENRPTSGDKFVGTYYDKQGIKSVQINKDGTFVSFTSGGKDIFYWKDNHNGTISVQSTPFTTSSTSGTSSTSPTIYYLYPHALRSSGNTYYK